MCRNLNYRQLHGGSRLIKAVSSGMRWSESLPSQFPMSAPACWGRGQGEYPRCLHPSREPFFCCQHGGERTTAGQVAPCISFLHPLLFCNEGGKLNLTDAMLVKNH